PASLRRARKGRNAMRFGDRTVLVTGSGRGIGRSIALRFAEEGARVALLARSIDQLTETARSVAELGCACAAIPADVRAPDAIRAAVERAEQELGPIEILVNNAGVFLYKPFLSLSAENWENVIATNLTGAANVCRAVLPGMVARRRG